MRDISRRTALGIGGSVFLASIAGATPPGKGKGKGRERDASPGLTQIGRYESGLYDDGGAEIPAYDPKLKRLFVVNAGVGGVDVINIANPEQPNKIGDIDGTEAFDGAGDTNNVAVHDGVLAVAIANADEQKPGRVAFYDTASRKLLNTVEVGALPDMVTFTPDGNTVLVANEGEPNDRYTDDPEGSVSVIDVSGGVENVTSGDVSTAGFGAFDAATLRAAGVRIYGEGEDGAGGATSTAAQDLEPEYIAVSPDSSTAYVTLQENNALAVVDVVTATVEAVVPLGYKDHSLPDNGFGESNALDAVDDGAIGIENQPLLGMYQPDTIDSIEIDGETYLVTANEGDAREYEALFEVGILTETSPGEFVLAIDDDGESDTEDVPIADGAYSQSELEELAGLEATAVRGRNGDGEIEQLYTFGGRSYAIWRADGDQVELVYESGDELEQITAQELPDDFNSDDDSVNDLDGESAASGPEPEGIAVGYVDATPVAFVGLEEIGGIVMVDITDPTAPVFVEYVNNRIFDLTTLGLPAGTDLGDAIENGDIEPGEAGDLAPEGLLFIPAEDAPKGVPLLVVGNEVSGTTTIYEVGL